MRSSLQVYFALARVSPRPITLNDGCQRGSKYACYVYRLEKYLSDTNVSRSMPFRTRVAAMMTLYS